MTLDDIVDALSATPAVLRRLVAGLPEATLRAGHDADTWSIKEVVAHLREAEEIALSRFERMAREERPFLAAYDQAAYAREHGYQEADTAAALAGFEDIRGRSAALFRGLQPADLARPGVHEEAGEITLGGHVEHVIAHDLAHLAQIARALG